jgi:hypothetical protein
VWLVRDVWICEKKRRSMDMMRRDGELRSVEALLVVATGLT